MPYVPPLPNKPGVLPWPEGVNPSTTESGLERLKSPSPYPPCLEGPNSKPSFVCSDVQSNNASRYDDCIGEINTGKSVGIQNPSQKHATPEQILLPPEQRMSVNAHEKRRGSAYELTERPQILRTKSGQVIPSALCSSPLRRSASEPASPKYVHFHRQLEEIRRFWRMEPPQTIGFESSAVSKSSSDSDSDTDSELRIESRRKTIISNPSCPLWQLVTFNFPSEPVAPRPVSVYLQHTWLSADSRYFFGSVVVENIAFRKSVICRFTLDSWQTMSEVAAHYIETVDGRDRFTFDIKLTDIANLESKRLVFCIQYQVNGKEFWDNNSGRDFCVGFRSGMESGDERQIIIQRKLSLPLTNPRPRMLNSSICSTYSPICLGSNPSRSKKHLTPVHKDYRGVWITEPLNRQKSNLTSPGLSFSSYEELIKNYCYMGLTRNC